MNAGMATRPCLNSARRRETDRGLQALIPELASSKVQRIPVKEGGVDQLREVPDLGNRLHDRAADHKALGGLLADGTLQCLGHGIDCRGECLLCILRKVRHWRLEPCMTDGEGHRPQSRKGKRAANDAIRLRDIAYERRRGHAAVFELRVAHRALETYWQRRSPAQTG